MRNEYPMRKTGFTLLELVIVIIIIGVLVGLALPKLMGPIRKARYAEAMSISRSIVNAQLLYYGFNREFADDIRKLSIEIPPSSTVAGGSYYIWKHSNYGGGYDPTMVGFGLGFDPQNPFNISKHKLGINMYAVNGEPFIQFFWWREDLPGQIGGGTLHTSISGWEGLQ